MNVKPPILKILPVTIALLGLLGGGCFPITEQMISSHQTQPQSGQLNTAPSATTTAPVNQPAASPTTLEPGAVFFIPFTIGLDLLLSPVYFLKAITDDSHPTSP